MESLRAGLFKHNAAGRNFESPRISFIFFATVPIAALRSHFWCQAPFNIRLNYGLEISSITS